MILNSRERPTNCIVGWIGQDLRRVMVTGSADPLADADLQHETDLVAARCLFADTIRLIFSRNWLTRRPHSTTRDVVAESH